MTREKAIKHIIIVCTIAGLLIIGALWLKISTTNWNEPKEEAKKESAQLANPKTIKPGQIWQYSLHHSEPRKIKYTFTLRIVKVQDSIAYFFITNHENNREGKDTARRNVKYFEQCKYIGEPF